MKSHLHFVIFLALIIASASCSSKGKGEPENTADESQSEASAAAGAESTLTAPPKLTAKDLNAPVDLIVATDSDLPKAEFDPAALVDAMDRNPQRLYEWVRDRTWWAPYRGLLRGAKGVMLDRVGSNLDRTVLLGDLLRRAGYKVRLAHSQLPEDFARELLSKVRPIPDQRRGPDAALEISAKRQRAAEAIIPGLAKALQDHATESKRRSDKGAVLVRSQTDQLYAMVKDAASLDNSVTDQVVIAALRDHWWVELEDNGKWIAMDVLAMDSKPGDALTKASQTSAWNVASESPSIPESEWHTVQIRLVVERYLAGATTESTVLETTLRPAQVFDRPITLIHVPKPWPDEPVNSTTNPNALRDAALNVRQWTPVLRVGDNVIAQSGFTESGDIKAHPFDPTADLGGGGLFGGLDSALGGGEEYEPYASAEWIDYEIRVPGQPIQGVRRQLFDLLGPGRRLAEDANFNGSAENRRLERSEALLSQTDILLQPCEFTNEFIAHLAMAGFVAQQGAIKELSLERDIEKRRSKASSIFDRVEIWGPLLGFASWRSALGNQHNDWFVSRPNVINLRIGQRLTGAEPPVLWQLIDIAANATDVHRGAARNPFEVRLERGVADTVAEMLTLTGNLSVAENTAAIFDMAGTRQSSGVVIAPRDTVAVSELGWPEDETARIAEDINAGYMVVALRQPVELRGIQRVGWWRVDPASGETIGVMDTGFHADTSENVTMQKDRTKQIADAYSNGRAPKGHKLTYVPNPYGGGSWEWVPGPTMLDYGVLGALSAGVAACIVGLIYECMTGNEC